MQKRATAGNGANGASSSTAGNGANGATAANGTSAASAASEKRSNSRSGSGSDGAQTKGPQTKLLAKKLGIPAFRLPLDSFYKNTLYGAHKTLNVDTTIQALSTYLDCRHWNKTFDLVLPPRYSRLKWEIPKALI